MGQNSAIEWTDHTFNPWWGCIKVSQGCKNCYAETLSSRYGHDVWGPTNKRRTFGENHWLEPIKWNKSAELQNVRMRVFCASMADVFEDNPGVESERAKLWSLISVTPMLDWLLLTKRPENIQRLTPWRNDWPTNVWAMTSIEDQDTAEERLPLLIQVPAVVRGLSVEPLLGKVNLEPWLNRVQWVIVGGESGPGARPMDIAWVRSIRDQCLNHGVPFFFKQWGEWSPSSDIIHKNKMIRTGKKASGRLLDNIYWNQLPRPTIYTPNR